jgi:adenylate cyclase
MSGGAGPGFRARLRRTRTAILLALLPGLVGALLMYWPPTEGLEKAGLDLLFMLRGPLPEPPRVRVVAIDDDSYAEFGVHPTSPWPRALHGELIRTLKAQGAKAIAFDVLFLEPGDPEQDEIFRSALQDTGIVVLGATVDQVDDPKFKRAQNVEPHEPFAAASARVAEVNLPRDRDGVIRSTFLMPDGRPGLALAAYEVATGDSSYRAENSRLIDYYGPPRTVKTVSLYQALEPEQFLPQDFFKDAVVFVGLSQAAAAGPAAKDAFLTPYRGAGGAATYGVEIHATVAANLLEGRRIDLLPRGVEAGMLILLPILASVAFAWLGPLYGLIALAVFAVLPLGTSVIAFNRFHLWAPTVIPAAIQLPLAYVVSVIWFYLTTVRDRERIKRAFSLYLSPAMTKQIAEDPTKLDLGGEEIVATAMFTDIKGFTTVAEAMGAKETAAMLNRYFSEATRHVFDTGGTLVKYIGDAVFAIWGAPLKMDDHAARACEAALAMSRMQAGGDGTEGPDHPVRKLVTRIGVHSGPMLVGNLGSAQRFDYTAIGDAVNLAARLEGLNKMFGTRAMISGDALAQSGGRFAVRRLGRIRVVGRAEPVEVHELIGHAGEATTPDAATVARFEAALKQFEAGRFAESAEGFAAVAGATGGADGPAAFYLKQARKYQEQPPAGWDGVVVAESK